MPFTSFVRFYLYFLFGLYMPSFVMALSPFNSSLFSLSSFLPLLSFQVSLTATVYTFRRKTLKFTPNFLHQ